LQISFRSLSLGTIGWQISMDIIVEKFQNFKNFQHLNVRTFEKQTLKMDSWGLPNIKENRSFGEHCPDLMTEADKFLIGGQ